MAERSSTVNVRPADDRPLGAAVEDGAGRGLRRGLQVLDTVLRAGGDGVRVIDLCRACALERATVYRLLATLIDCGYVAQRRRFRYVAGPRTLAPRPSRTSTRHAARLQPVLERVSAGCGDAAFAVVQDGGDALCIARQVGTYPVQVLDVHLGFRQPLGVGAAGLALLASLPAAEAEQCIAHNGEALPRYGGMTASRLQILVRATRERGWSVVGNHAAKGALGVGMAVLDAQGAPVAGISVAAQMARMPLSRQKLIARLMREALAALLPDGL